MIIEIKVRRCPKCNSVDIIKNGHDYKGAQKFHCKACGAYGTLDKKGPSAQTKQQQGFGGAQPTPHGCLL